MMYVCTSIEAYEKHLHSNKDNFKISALKWRNKLMPLQISEHQQPSRY